MWKMVGMGWLMLASQACGDQGVADCKARLQAVNARLAFANAYNNAGQIAGLEQAARNITTYCADSGLRKLLTAQQQQVSALQQAVDEHVSALHAAKASGQTDMQAKQQDMLAASQERLLDAQRELDELDRLISQ